MTEENNVKKEQLEPELQTQNELSINKALGFKRKDWLAHYHRGVSLDKLQREEEALKAFDESLSINPKYLLAHYGRGIILLHTLQQYKEALAAFDNVLAINPQDSLAHRNRGIALYQLQQNEDALEAFDQALKFKPQDCLSHYRRGIVLLTLQRNEDALEAFDQALKINPQDCLAHYQSGVILFHHLGRPKDALIALKKALKIHPDLAEAKEMFKTITGKDYDAYCADKLRSYHEKKQKFDTEVHKIAREIGVFQFRIPKDHTATTPQNQATTYTTGDVTSDLCNIVLDYAADEVEGIDEVDDINETKEKSSSSCLIS